MKQQRFNMKRTFTLILVLLSISLLLAGCNEEKRQTESASNGRIQGSILTPLSGTYLYIYKQGMDLYGPAFAVSEMTGVDGSFDLTLPSGDYIVVARKRASGDAAGPVVAGDNKSEFINLKVTGDMNDLKIIAPEKVGDSRRLSEEAKKEKTALAGRILNVDGEPVEGSRVHVYDHVQMSERPKFVSEKTGPDGKYLIFLPEGGTYYICARDKFGGPPKLGDLYGRYDQGTIEPSAVVIKSNEILQEVDITVTKVW